MTKTTLNSTLHRAIKESSTADISAAHDALSELCEPFYGDEKTTAAEHLVYVALSTASGHLWQEHLIRQAKNYRRMKGDGPSTKAKWARQLDDRSLEQQYMREHRHVLMHRHELNRGGHIPEDETESAQTHEELFAAINEEIDRRGLRASFADNQELRNTNFNPDDPRHKARLAQNIAIFLSGVSSDMWGETLRLCERDVEIAMETGEMALIDQERAMLDAVRDHIRENKIKLEVPGANTHQG
jgi:hypothetical protein